MLCKQLREWNMYPDWVKEQMDVLITDDCSERYPITEVLEDVDCIKLRAFRIKKKVAWNWLACRNIGAHHSTSKWLLLTDIDHILLVEDAEKLMIIERLLNQNTAYLLARRNAKDNKIIDSHGNSYLLTRDMYWLAGGYNELYSGNYWNTSGTFRRQLRRVAKMDTLDIPLTLFTSDVVKDAECTLPKRGRAVTSKDIRTLILPYEEIKL
jgi:hypothetical protein